VADFSRRTDSIRWDSPTVAGFVLSAAAGEAATVDRFASSATGALDATSFNGPLGFYWSAALRYAGEFSGFRVAAAAAYEHSDGDENMTTSSPLGPITGTAANTGLSASVMHVASGLFAQGSWIRFERPNLVGLDTAGKVQGGGTDSGTLWQIQGGIAKNWTGLGNTVLYGEYAHGNNLQRTFNILTVDDSATAVAANLSNNYDMWGLGLVQNIDAAAMEVYVAFRNHSLDRDATTGAAVQDIQTVMGGMRIAF
jgi:hypothetical protein